MIKRYLALLALLVMVFSVSAQKLQYQGGKVYQHDRLYTGVEKVFYDTLGYKVKAHTHYKKGLKDGVEYYFYADGQKKAERWWKKGKKAGQWKSWGEASVLLAVASYLKGKKHGTWKVWDKTGQLLYLMHYRKGKRVGHWQQWNRDGVLVMEKQY